MQASLLKLQQAAEQEAGPSDAGDAGPAQPQEAAGPGEALAPQPKPKLLEDATLDAELDGPGETQQAEETQRDRLVRLVSIC